jgi:hypothetical protein
MSPRSVDHKRKVPLALSALALAGSLAYGGALLSERYTLALPALVGGSASTVSVNYRIQTGTLGQALTGGAQSAGYQNSGGTAGPALALANPPAADLGDAYVYPNPFKPNSPGRFQAAKITFKRLPAAATIKVFSITGRLVAELRKTDINTDYYEWDAVNDEGQKLASGV